MTPKLFTNLFALGAITLSALVLPAGCALAQAPAKRAATASAVPHWTAMPLLTPSQKAAGVFPGGEGCQWPRGFVRSDADPDLMILPIDVGGLYRTLDGGKHWEQASVGWDARGCNDVAFDPRNASRMIGLAGNSMNWDPLWGPSPHGIYVSTNKAASWKHVVGLTERVGHKAAYDASSFDAQKGYCTVAYVASPTAGLLRTNDGGETWNNVSDICAGKTDGDWGVLFLKIHPKTGAVYVGQKDGLHVSNDAGKTFAKLMDGDVYGLEVPRESPDTVYISGTMGLQKSTDGGKTFALLAAKGVDREKDNKPVRNVAVSAADPDYLSAWVQGDNWKWSRYYSHDGGATFAESTFVKGKSPMPMNVRQGYFLWDPRDKNIVYSLGGDCVTRSVDGGKTFNWYNNGYNGVMMGGMMNFSAHAPKTVFLAFQDYNSAATQDGGATWNYYDSSGKGWGGHCYGGHAVDASTFFYGDAEDWNAPRRIRITHDAGKTWEFVKGADGKEINLGGANVSLSDPTDANILFCYDHRSTDKGKTWQKMADCDGVFTYSPTTKMLFGRKGDGVVVRSKDKGATWETISDSKGHVDDVAVNHKTGVIFVAGDEQLKRYTSGKWETVELPADQFGNKLRCVTVATDPRDPDTVYVGGPRNVYATHCTVARSTDGGKTWRNLTVTTPIGEGVNNGPHEVACIRVNPETGEAWAAGQCYGMWRIPAPASGEIGTTAALASAPKSLRPALAPMPASLVAAKKAETKAFVIALSNGDMEAGTDAPDGWTEKWEGRGKIAISRDTSVYKSGKASLHIKTTGDTQAQAGQSVDNAPAGATFTVSGMVKSKGNIKVNFGIQPRSDSWTPIGLLQVGYTQNDSDWQSFTKTVTLPEGSKHASVILFIEGDGEAWLDDVKVSAAGGSSVVLSVKAPVDDKKTDAPEYQAPPAKLDPMTPMHGFFADYPTAWLNYARSLKSDAQAKKADVIFLGDSITQNWKDQGKAEWDKRFAPINAINVGIGGDKTNQVLWRINDGLLDGLSPKLVVLAIGVNNVWGREFGMPRIAEATETCIKAIQAKVPNAKVLAVGILPTQKAGTNELRGFVKEINADVKKRVATMKNVRFLDIGDKFLTPDGTLTEEIMPDFVHPNAKGYVIYGDNLEPIVKEMLKK